MASGLAITVFTIIERNRWVSRSFWWNEVEEGNEV